MADLWGTCCRHIQQNSGTQRMPMPCPGPVQSTPATAGIGRRQGTPYCLTPTPTMQRKPVMMRAPLHSLVVGYWAQGCWAVLHMAGMLSRTPRYGHRVLVLCAVYCLLCTVYCVLCTVYCVLCIVHYVLRSVHCVLCVAVFRRDLATVQYGEHETPTNEKLIIG